MKILFIAEANPHSRGHQRLKALEDLGHDVHGCPLYDPNIPLDSKGSILHRIAWKIGYPIDSFNVNDRIMSAIRSQGKFDIIWIEKGNTVKLKTIKRLKALMPKSKLVSYSEDDMFNISNRSRHYTNSLPLYDVIFTTKSYNCNESELPSLGAKRVIFVNKSFDKYTHYPVGISEIDRTKYGAEVGFIGTYEYDRTESMKYLAKNGIEVRVWGSGWENVKDFPNLRLERKELYGDEYRKGICSTDINLCFLRKANRDLQTDRTMEIPACKSVMLAERTDEHSLLFEEGKEAIYFSNNQELLSKVRHFLKHKEQLDVIALSAYHRCQTSNYTHHDRLQWMLSQI